MDCRVVRSYEFRGDGEIKVPGEGKSGNEDGGTANGGGGCISGGVIPLGDSVSE